MHLKMNKKLVCFLSLFFTFLLMIGQEVVLVGLNYDYNLVKNNENKLLKSAKQTLDTVIAINLPLIDDFFYNSDFPDQSIWESGNAKINNHLALNPPTIGVVTFDAIDGTGRVYKTDENDYGKVLKGDSLTSLPIITSGADNLFLSFMYQPGGFEKIPDDRIPDEKDSLILQFFIPDSNIWKTVWKAQNYVKDSSVMEVRGNDTIYYKPDPQTIVIIDTNEVAGFPDSVNIDTTIMYPRIETLSTFKQVIIPVNDTNYLKTDSFRFRFVSHFSISEKTPYKEKYPRTIGNNDTWHIDYVKLDANRNINDTLINDLSFINSVDSIFIHYTSIPTGHSYSSKGANEWSLNPKVNIKNNYNRIVNFERSLILEDVIKNVAESNNLVGDTIKEYSMLGLRDKMNGPLRNMLSYLRNEKEQNKADSARLLFKYIISAEDALNDRKENDTLKYELKLENYYSYDDGTPDLGIGIVGTGSQNAQMAQLFEPLTGDTLRGVYIFFNRSLNDDDLFFKMTIWNPNNEKPGDTLYSREVKVEFDEGFYNFHYYPLDSPIYISNPFYVGWIQIKEEFMNLGFDTFRDNSSKIFVNITGEWEGLQEKGTLMIRPVFGKFFDPYLGSQKEKSKSNLKVYPNPVRNRLIIENNNYFDPVNYSIIDLQGRLIKSGIVENETIDCSDLQKGIYIFTFRINGVTRYKKIIVDRSY